MTKQFIDQYMWGYQEHFAWGLKYLAEKVFAELGVQLKPDVLLVGILKTEDCDRYAVCVEPENGKWDHSLFAGIPTRYPETIKKHPLQRMVYGDEPSNREKPENIRRSSATIVVQESLEEFDRENEVKSFCGEARPVGNYYVVPVVQIPIELFRQFPPLSLPKAEDRFRPSGDHSLVHSCLFVLLDEASRDLLGPNPGRSTTSGMRSAPEIVAEGAENFMRIPDGLTAERHYGSGDLFQRLNIISSLFYEREKGIGKLELVRPDNPCIDYLVRFNTPVPFRHPRWARKILAMSGSGIALIASEGQIFGLGRIKPDHDATAIDVFTINFLDHYQWELRCGDLPLLYSRYREAQLPLPPISRERFESNFLRIFRTATSANSAHLWTLFESGASLGHGSMLVVAEDAAFEATRLADQGTAIHPVSMTPELLESVSGIDGSILLDPAGVCYAIGVILDGEANEECSPARGSRFNSALRYVGSNEKRRMAIVISDDRTVDIVPLLEPQIRKSEIDKFIEEFECASVDTYHAAQNWLDKHRFYLGEKECLRINAVRSRLDKLPREVGEIRYIAPEFRANPDISEGDFLL